MSEITHQPDEQGTYRQIVSPSRLRDILDAAGDDYSRPDWMTDEDEWDAGVEDNLGDEAASATDSLLRDGESMRAVAAAAMVADVISYDALWELDDRDRDDLRRHLQRRQLELYDDSDGKRIGWLFAEDGARLLVDEDDVFSAVRPATSREAARLI